MWQQQLASLDAPAAAAVSPMREMGAYEALWLRPETTFPRLAAMFRRDPSALPSDLVPEGDANTCAGEAIIRLRERGVTRFGVRVHRAGEYPQKLRDATSPVELLYFRGWWNFVETRCVSVVGTRHPSEEGLRRARKIAAQLAADELTVVSGLAAGIDTAAHQSALEKGGRTIAVAGTPLGAVYPAENASLQEIIAREHLLISQVPVLRYARQSVPKNRFFFPERNKTMSALSEATIVVEAGETSGTLIQARAALKQGRKLLILDSCFRNPDISWPRLFESKGAVRVRDYDEIRAALDR
jgi:DNA processing protein